MLQVHEGISSKTSPKRKKNQLYEINSRQNTRKEKPSAGSTLTDGPAPTAPTPARGLRSHESWRSGLWGSRAVQGEVWVLSKLIETILIRFGAAQRGRKRLVRLWLEKRGPASALSPLQGSAVPDLLPSALLTHTLLSFGSMLTLCRSPLPSPVLSPLLPSASQHSLPGSCIAAAASGMRSAPQLHVSAPARAPARFLHSVLPLHQIR